MEEKDFSILIENEPITAEPTEQPVELVVQEDLSETQVEEVEELQLEEVDSIQEKFSTEEVPVQEEATAESEVGEELSEDEKLELELKRVNEELKDLDALIEKAEARVAVHNVFDTQEGADEVGISGEYDDYGREILDDVFENRLRMSTNGIKLAYSKVKNAFLSYKGTKQSYDKLSERFSLEKASLISV